MTKAIWKTVLLAISVSVVAAPACNGSGDDRKQQQETVDDENGEGQDSAADEEGGEQDSLAGIEKELASVFERMCRVECDLYSECYSEGFGEDYGNLEECYEDCDCKKECEKYRNEEELSINECFADCEARETLEKCKAACSESEGWFGEADSIEECRQQCASVFTRDCVDAFDAVLDCWEQEAGCEYGDSPSTCEDAEIGLEAVCGTEL